MNKSRLWGKRFLHRLDLRTVQWHVRAAWTSNYWCEDGGRKIWADLSEKIWNFTGERWVFPTKFGFFTRKHRSFDPNLDALGCDPGPKKPPSSRPHKSQDADRFYPPMTGEERDPLIGSPQQVVTGWSGLKHDRFMKASLETENEANRNEYKTTQKWLYRDRNTYVLSIFLSDRNTHKSLHRSP